MVKNELTINVATVNGSGSQSANTVLLKTFFRMGLPVAGKNLFPSNIAGLPTWFNIRVSEKGLLSRKLKHDIVVAMNPATALQDLASLQPGGVFIYNSDLKIAVNAPSDTLICAVPFKELADQVTDSIKLKKLLSNMIYVGVVANLLRVDLQLVQDVVKTQFEHKEDLIGVNQKAIEVGFTFADQNLNKDRKFPFFVERISDGNKNSLIIDGNSASAMGLLFGGCTFLSWYPITPSSSLAESFQKYLHRYRRDEDGKIKGAVVQAEDELAAISMVLGAGWAGARAITATSGPGLSLMAEAAGLSYFAEIPAVIWDVQRVGPSTGLPTRTMQGDLLSAHHLSHGDTQHVVLLPGTVEECFEFGQTAFDLAEALQTLVIVLTDLDLAMNLWVTPEFKFPDRPFERGKVLNADQVTKEFSRYKDVDGDGIPYRTLPGNPNPHSAYFTRGTGHDETSRYSEDPVHFKSLMSRLAKKMETAKKMIPKAKIDLVPNAKIGFIAFGSSLPAVEEARYELKKPSSFFRLRALPLTEETEEFIKSHEKVFVVEQNRDGQLFQLIRSQFPHLGNQLYSLRQFDGLPLAAETLMAELKALEVV